MKERFLIVMSAIVFLAACTSGAISTDDISHIQANCQNVDQQIAMLEKEKKDHNNRVAAGAGDIMPVTAVARLVTGSYDTNMKIASGEWAKMIDNKLTQLRTLKAQCSANTTPTSY